MAVYGQSRNDTVEGSSQGITVKPAPAKTGNELKGPEPQTVDFDSASGLGPDGRRRRGCTQRSAAGSGLSDMCWCVCALRESNV